MTRRERRAERRADLSHARREAADPGGRAVGASDAAGNSGVATTLPLETEL
jgi:hypothetical protein